MKPLSMLERRFPTGEFIYGKTYTPDQTREHVLILSHFPERLSELVKDFTPEQWHSVYRDRGWTGAQVLHHIADSHLNGYFRLKLALTESNPVVRGFDEALWAELLDTRTDNIQTALSLIAAVHEKISIILSAPDEALWTKSYFHPGIGRLISLREFAALYAYHGNHHYAHLELIKSGA
jgi:DinB family protein